MFTRRLFLIGALAALGACSDSGPRAITVPQAALPVTPRQAEMVGTVVLPGSHDAAAYLRTQDALVPLRGAEAILLSNLDGAEVAVRGIQGTEPGLAVESFTVLAVGGRAVIDGILEQQDGAFALRLATGDRYVIADAPEALAAHIGARIWVTAMADSTQFEFGIIRDNQ